MLKRYLPIIFLFALLVASVKADDAPVFTLQGDQPVVVHGAANKWDGRYTDPGAVFYHDGLFHMFRNGFKAWPASVQIGYLTSPDGIKWTEASPDPVLKTEDVSYAKVAALASSAVVEDDGTWALYFYTWNSYAALAADGEIGRTTAADPAGPWKVDDAPVLKLGSAGEWDEGQLSGPSVLRTDKGYIMFYTGFNKKNQGMVGMATSEDGVHWMKYDDPATKDAPFAESDPVLRYTEDWEATTAYQPRVVPTPDGFVMVYRSVGAQPGPASRGKMRLGLATSKDGIHWTKDARNPVFDINSFNGMKMLGFWYTALAYHDDTYYLYVEGTPFGKGFTDIYVATHKGSLLP
jgi:predicted GH43/DUF377 family glycosyl hydrolase